MCIVDRLETGRGIPRHDGDGIAGGERGNGGNIMTVEAIGEKYRCNICGNEVTVTAAGGGTLVCCGEDMEKIG